MLPVELAVFRGSRRKAKFAGGCFPAPRDRTGGPRTQPTNWAATSYGPLDSSGEVGTFFMCGGREEAPVLRGHHVLVTMVVDPPQRCVHLTNL